jgi:adenine-specific DNA-methyltransferase
VAVNIETRNSSPTTDTVSLIVGDCRTKLASVQNESVQLVVSSPPYNIGKEYERDENLSLIQYKIWIRPIVKALSKKIKPSGSLCWQVGNHVENGQVYPLDYFFFEEFQKCGLQLRNRIVWTFNFGLNANRRLSGRYETMLWFTKTNDYVFNLDSIRVPQLYPGKRHSANKGERSGKLSGNPLGKNPSDYWEFSTDRYFRDEAIWQLPNVKANHPEKTPHPCQFPLELVERCVLGFTRPNDVVLDPFVGSGTSVLAAVKHGRRAIGIDKDARYIDIARSRLLSLTEGTLRHRPSGMRVQRPDPTSKVASTPDEWLVSDR